MLHEALRLLRVFHDMRQGELAERLGISRSHISEIENDNKKPSIDVIEKYAIEFKIPVSSIMFFAENVENPDQRKNQLAKAKGVIATKIISFLQTIEERTSDA